MQFSEEKWLGKDDESFGMKLNPPLKKKARRISMTIKVALIDESAIFRLGLKNCLADVGILR